MRLYKVRTENNALTFISLRKAFEAIAELRRYENRTPFAHKRKVYLTTVNQPPSTAIDYYDVMEPQ